MCTLIDLPCPHASHLLLFLSSFHPSLHSNPGLRPSSIPDFRPPLSPSLRSPLPSSCRQPLHAPLSPSLFFFLSIALSLSLSLSLTLSELCVSAGLELCLFPVGDLLNQYLSETDPHPTRTRRLTDFPSLLLFLRFLAFLCLPPSPLLLYLPAHFYLLLIFTGS